MHEPRCCCRLASLSFLIFSTPLLPNQRHSPPVGCWHRTHCFTSASPSPPPSPSPQLSRVMGRMVLGQQTRLSTGLTGSWTCRPTCPIPVDCFPRRRLDRGHRPTLSVSSPCVYRFILSPGWCLVAISSPLIGAVGSGSLPPSGLQLQTAVGPYLEPAESPLRVRPSSSYSAPRSSCCVVIVRG